MIEAAARASEPTRASFEGAYTEFSHDPEIERLIERIAAYPEWERERKIKSLLAYHEALSATSVSRRSSAANEYFARRCVLELIFYAARLGLAL